MNHEGQCCMYVLAETKLAKDAMPVKDVKLNLERHDIWDFLWAEDDAELFVVAQRNSAVVYRNRDPEVFFNSKRSNHSLKFCLFLKPG
jgi:hypothetical protein